MRIGYDLSARQTLSQKLTVAPRMIQSMEILQLPLAELQARIEKELQENPVLELRDAPPDSDVVEVIPPEFNADSPLKHDLTDNGAELEFKRLEEIDRDWGGVFNEEEQRPSRSQIDELGDKKADVISNLMERPQSLQDYLAEQLAEMEMTDDDRMIAMHIISMLDRTGYVGRRNDNDEFLPVSLHEIAVTCEPPTTPERVDEVLSLVQDLDPPGVGARDLRECLMLQIQGDTPHRELVRTILQDHLDDLSHHRIPAICKKTMLPPETIRDAIEVIKHFNPKPGLQYSSESTRYVTPDVILEKTDDGGYEIRLTDDWVPRLNFSKQYVSMFRDKENDSGTRDWIKKKLQSAKFLCDAVEQRRNTLMKVTRAIINHQKEFLDQGPDAIKPLKMQEIADQVKVHVTTVSRAVDDKWMQTPRGVFPLKRFFVGAAVNKDTGEQIPWEKVKKALLDMVGNEDKANPLSDEDLEEKLTAAGFPVKRRTVTKYRKLLNIPSSRERKESADV